MFNFSINSPNIGAALLSEAKYHKFIDILFKNLQASKMESNGV
jgi:hypothetical protein